MSPGEVGVRFESSVLTGAGESTEGSTNGREAACSEYRTVGMREGDEIVRVEREEMDGACEKNGRRNGMTTVSAGKKSHQRSPCRTSPTTSRQRVCHHLLSSQVITKYLYILPTSTRRHRT